MLLSKRSLVLPLLGLAVACGDEPTVEGMASPAMGESSGTMGEPDPGPSDDDDDDDDDDGTTGGSGTTGAPSSDDGTTTGDLETTGFETTGFVETTGPETTGVGELEIGAECEVDEDCVTGVCWDFNDYDPFCGGTACSASCETTEECVAIMTAAGAPFPGESVCGADERCTTLGTGFGLYFCAEV